jgi:hypothetical protein
VTLWLIAVSARGLATAWHVQAAAATILLTPIVSAPFAKLGGICIGPVLIA